MSASNKKEYKARGFITVFDKGIIDMFDDWGYLLSTDPSNLLTCKFAVFPGGEDISPFLYGQRRVTECGPINLRRDMRESRFYRHMLRDMPKLGICRGAQFLNVMNGGSLYQHVDNHAIANGHPIRMFFDTQFKPVKGETTMFVTSTHHQLMVPSTVSDCIVMGMAKEATTKIDDTHRTVVGNKDGKWRDAEVIYYPDTHSLCYQPHPEYVKSESHPCRAFFKQTFEHMMGITYGVQK